MTQDSLYAILALIAVLVSLLAAHWIERRRLHATLGCSVTELSMHIAGLGEGDHAPRVPVRPDANHSILAWVAQAQSSFSRLDLKRKDAEARNQRLSHLYTGLSECNHAIVRCTDEMQLFSQVCESVVIHGGMKMAWIGALDEEGRQIQPIASYGRGTEYLVGLRISVDANEALAHGPTGTAFREVRPVWCQDFQNDPATAPWHARGKKFGWGSGAALPLKRDSGPNRVMTLYTDAPHAFDSEARALLMGMALDIDYAVCAIAHKEQHRRAQQRIQYLAHYDALTGLPNRSSLEEHAHQLIGLAQRQHRPIAWMVLDLDHFKDINDTLGHRAGDLLLVELASRLRRELRQSDIVSRFGGDEFVLLFDGMDAQAACLVAQNLLDVIAVPFLLEHYDLNVTGSIGIALYPEDGNDAATLCKNADAAMYHIKQQGRHGYCFFTAEMQARSARKLQVVNALRHAVNRDQLKLHYQPQVSLHDGRVIGVEALVRWTHPELGVISPAEFIPAAEESGLILPIGEWVLRQATRHANIWLARGLPPMVMAINLSVVQFRHPDLPKLITSILDDEGLQPEFLELELTEGVALTDPQGAVGTMNDLHERGIRMSIDDFGTGYSSLNYLKKFKVYKLKIDQSFVRDIGTDPEDRAIVAAIIHMAKSLGLRTIAEGVETAEQVAFLREQGCDEVQGYYFSRPLLAEHLETLVQSWDTD